MVLSSNPYSATSPGVTQLLILSAPWLSYLSTGSRLSRVAVMGTQPAITQCSTTALETWAAEGACVGRRCTLLGVCHTPAQSHVSEYGLNASFSQLYSIKKLRLREGARLVQDGRSRACFSITSLSAHKSSPTCFLWMWLASGPECWTLPVGTDEMASEHARRSLGLGCGALLWLLLQGYTKSQGQELCSLALPPLSQDHLSGWALNGACDATACLRTWS